jgi:hypothetical protein
MQRTDIERGLAWSTRPPQTTAISSSPSHSHRTIRTWVSPFCCSKTNAKLALHDSHHPARACKWRRSGCAGSETLGPVSTRPLWFTTTGTTSPSSRGRPATYDQSRCTCDPSHFGHRRRACVSIFNISNPLKICLGHHHATVERHQQ